MKRLLAFWQTIRYSLWFLPAIIVAFSIALAALAIEVDALIGEDVLSRWPRLFGANAEGARAMLEVIAGAMITIAGLTFSITVLVLSLGASQYTPRVIRTFMGNRPTQAVLGVFIGIFVYCLIVLRSIRGGEEAFIPSVAVVIGILLALVGVGFLVFFIHHIANSIQASTIVAGVAETTTAVIDTLFPEPLHRHPEKNTPADGKWERQQDWIPIASPKTGYLQTVDTAALAACACRNKFTLRMEKEIGEFVIEGLPLAWITPKPADDICREIAGRYSIGAHRTVEQDIGVGIRQMVDIALRAISPAVNDTTTAVLCIDFLSAIMIKLAPRHIAPDDVFHDGRPAVFAKGPGFNDFLCQSFDQIREHAHDNAAIYARLLDALDTIGGSTIDPARRADIARQVQQVWVYAKTNIEFPDQLERISTRHQRTMESLQVSFQD